MAEPVVSIVIPSFRSLRTLGFTLRSVFTQSAPPDYEVVLVDSSGTDLSGWVRSRFPSVRLIQPPERHFPGAARNLGAVNARGGLLAFLDADVVADRDWLHVLEARIRETGRPAAGGYVGNANPTSLSSRVQHWLEFSEFVPGTPSGHRSFLSTSNLMLRRDLFLDTGGFAEEWEMSEDSQFFRRTRITAWFEGSVGVHHHHRSRWTEVLRHLKELGFWSGRLRTCEDVPGAFLRHLPAAAMTLPGLRIPRVIIRLWRANPREGRNALLALPCLAVGAAAWTAGFSKGLRAGDPAGGPVANPPRKASG